jgi:hypothetical protein
MKSLWRVRWWLALAVTIGALIAPAAPAQAEFLVPYCGNPGPIYATAYIAQPRCPIHPLHQALGPNYQGWAHVQSVPAWTAAYRWDGSAWRGLWMQADQSVYASPYAGGWTWAWSQQTGWVAMQRGDLYHL